MWVKTKELIVDFRKRQQRSYTPLMISGTPVERVSSFKYLGVNISEDLTWTTHIQTQVKKARQRPYHLRQLRKFRVSPSILKTFYSGAIESVLTRTERLIAFAIISQYEKTRFFNCRGCDYTLSCYTRGLCMTIVWHLSMVRESIKRRPLSYSSRGTLMTHTNLSSSAASSRTHLSSIQRKHQVGTLCCQVCSLPQVVFVSAGLS